MSQTKLTYPKEKKIPKGGGEYHYADSGTEHQITPCNQSAVHREIKTGTSVKTPGKKGGGMLQS